jgi:hypothetical protein
MRSIDGASRLQMRFTFQVRSADGWQRVAGPRLDHWVSSAPGRERYVYVKRFQNLPVGVSRVRVRFRWKAADGAVLRSALRRSHGCRVPDPRPDLVPLAIDVGPGSAPDRRSYTVTIANHGRSVADASSVALSLAGTALPDGALPSLEPGTEGVAVFDGPACPAGSALVTVADATGLINEALEADDVLTVPCP